MVNIYFILLYIYLILYFNFIVRNYINNYMINLRVYECIIIDIVAE